MKILIKLWNFLKYLFAIGNAKNSKEKARRIVMNNHLTSGIDIAIFVHQKMIYVSDPLFGVIDIQQDLDYTAKRGWEGDCDDYAGVAYRLIEQLGRKPHMLTLIRKDPRENHVVCVYEENGDWYLIGNEGYEKYSSFGRMIVGKEAINYSLDRLK